MLQVHSHVLTPWIPRSPIREDIITPLLRQRSVAQDKWWVQKHGPASDRAGVIALLIPKLPPDSVWGIQLQKAMAIVGRRQ